MATPRARATRSSAARPSRWQRPSRSSTATRHLTLAWLAAAEQRWSDAARDIDEARGTFKDTTQSGDHTPQLLRKFGEMSWPSPVGERVKQWLGLVARR